MQGYRYGPVGVCPATKLLESQAGFIDRRSGGMTDVLAEDRERLPQGKGFESQDDFGSTATGHLADERQVTPQEGLIDQIVGCAHQ